MNTQQPALNTSVIQNTPIVLAAANVAITDNVNSPSWDLARRADPDLTVESYVRSYFAKTPVLARVAYCESKFKQFNDDGSILRGKLTPADVGVMQVNEYYHADKAEKMGYDLHTVDGNLAYAKYLYSRQGTAPWSASESCWGN